MSLKGGTGADYAPPVASLSVLGEIAIFVQRRFVNLFTDKRIYTPGSGRYRIFAGNEIE